MTDTLSRTGRDEASDRQIRAARPDVSTWLGANAGSGKTRVLTDRVARLLLAGTDPQTILCLTYTKAAASEMQNRLFERLGKWAMLPDDALRDALRDMGVEDALDGAILPRARRLFAAAIETPGGLKIQTIHAFCSHLLRRFPLEAGVTPGFREMDDRGRADLLDTALASMATDRPDLFMPCAAHVSDADLHGLAGAILSRRAALTAAPDRDALAQMLGLERGLDLRMLQDRVFTSGTIADLEKIVPVLAAGKATDVKMADHLRPCLTEEDPLRSLGHLESGLLTKGGTILKTLGTKDTRLALGGLADALTDLAERTLVGRNLRIGLFALERHAALHAFAQDLLPRIDALKAQRGLLDFADLIDRTHALLHRPGVAEWVLYKLDGGIDHVLVDEAQDTAPQQWEIIASLTESFTADLANAGQRPRTLFVVGDFKQSIYSFQGADPARFHKMRASFAHSHDTAGRKLHSGALEHSFRSSPAVLEAVDSVFAAAPEASLGGPVRHRAFHEALPGRVDLWPALQQDKPEDATPWHTPVDAVSAESDRFVLARSLADEIARMIREERLPTKNGPRRVHAGDILILVRGRVNGLFDAIITACKARGIKVAGADRLKLEGELAVQDILALLRFLDTTEDSLSLAAVLRSPLFGLSEDALFRLAALRPDRQILWEALRAGTEHRDTVAVLQDLLGAADFLRPLDLINRILIRHGGRGRLIARMGPEARDGIDAVIELARSYEREHAASLTGFLAWIDAGETEIKRQAEGAGDALRVMTVHGAKGLEAPIVILPDTANQTFNVRSDLLDTDSGDVVWKGRKDGWLPLTDQLVEDAKTAQAEEDQRVLYVAMTRAKNWLIVCAAGRADNDTCWHGQITGALQDLAAAALETPVGPGYRHARSAWPDAAPDSGHVSTSAPAPEPPLPGWALLPAPTPPAPPEPVRASGLPGAKALPGEGLPPEEAMRRGTVVHRLLEDLPLVAPMARPALAQAIAQAEGLDRALAEELSRQALAVLETAAFGDLFADGTLAEVPVTAQMPDGRRLHGIVDRLIVSDGAVHAVDYKTNRALPEHPQDIPAGVLAQMGAYAQALRAIYPDHAIRLSILWTAGPALMDVPLPLAEGALASALTA